MKRKSSSGRLPVLIESVALLLAARLYQLSLIPVLNDDVHHKASRLGLFMYILRLFDATGAEDLSCVTESKSKRKWRNGGKPRRMKWRLAARSCSLKRMATGGFEWSKLHSSRLFTKRLS